MPGWPSVGRADDQRLLEALRRADSRAADSLYDTYADRLSDYARSLLDDTDIAAESVHDAIVTAHGRTGALREPARLRAWLYALTRYQCTTRRGRTPAHGSAAISPPEGDEEDPELAAIVREALAELGQKEREVLLLALRHELTTSEIAPVLGLTSRQAANRLGRARDHLENAASAVILARTGRAHCPDLSALVDSLEGPLPQPLRRRLTRHIIGCKECTEGRHRRVSAERLLDAIPVAFPPLSLRRRVAETCARSERDAVRTAIITVADGFDKNGFPPPGPERRARSEQRGARSEHPVPADVATLGYGTEAAHEDAPRRGSRTRQTGRSRVRAARGTSRRSAPIFATIACVLLATAAMVVATGQDASRPDGTQTLRFPPGELRISYAPEPTDPPPSADRPSPAPNVPTTGSPSRAAAPVVPSATPRASASRTPARAAPRPAAKLVVSCPDDLGVESAGVILLSARNATIEWTAATSGALTLRPARGTLTSGAKVRVSVLVSEPGEPGEAVVTIRSAAGRASCEVTWDGPEDPPASDPPSDQPPTPEPTVSDAPTEESTAGPT